jgi:hypothetical protein
MVRAFIRVADNWLMAAASSPVRMLMTMLSQSAVSLYGTQGGGAFCFSGERLNLNLKALAG